MNMSKTLRLAVLVALGALSGNALAADEPIYGHQLMTEQERIQHRETMRNMATEEERNAYRHEHHKRMRERAMKQGIELPEEPPMQGRGRKQGMGQGMGNGMGQGMGGGKGGKR